MRPRFVSVHEMRWHRSHSDELDAMLEGSAPDGAADLAQVAAVLRRMRSTYDGPPPRPSGELAAFMEAPLTTDKGDLPVTAGSNANGPVTQVAGLPKWRESIERRRTKVLSAVAAFVASVTGKVVLGTAVAAASVGGLHAADVVDLPVLPDNNPPVVVEQHGPGDDVGTEGHHGELPEEADVPQAVQDYLVELETYVECVATNAASRGDTQSDETTRTTGAFDPREGCGDRPDAPGPAVASEASDGASDQGQTNSEQGTTAREEGLENVPEGASTNAEEGQSNDPTNQGEDVPAEGAGTSGAPDDVATEGAGDEGDDARSEHQPERP